MYGLCNYQEKKWVVAEFVEFRSLTTSTSTTCSAFHSDEDGIDEVAKVLAKMRSKMGRRDDD